MRRISSEDRAGVYVTVIFHLAVIIVLLLVQIGSQLKGETGFLMDFSKQEEIERRERETDFKEDISRRLDDLIGMSAPAGTPVRNVTVDRGAPLKDDRNTDAEDLYRENERLQRDLKGLDSRQEDARDETVELNGDRTSARRESERRQYSGPSVLSWTLDGRKAGTLPVPAYKCYNGGDVTVLIKVNNSGVVVSAKVVEAVSSDDGCLRKAAVRAARTSRFSMSSTAPPNQIGEITYRFISQS